MRILDTKRAVRSRLSLRSAAMLLVLAAILLPQVRGQQKAGQAGAAAERNKDANGGAVAALNPVVKEIASPFREGNAYDQRLSPDGTRMVIAGPYDPKNRNFAAPELLILDLNTKSETSLIKNPQRDRVWRPIWSPLGGQVAYANWHFDLLRQGVFGIRTVSTSGGEPRTLHEAPEQFVALDWSADGKWILAHTWLNNTKSFWSIPVEGGGARQLVQPAAGEEIAGGQISPDGETIVYTRIRNGKGSIYLFQVATQRETPVAETSARVALWSKDGRHVLFIDNTGDGWHLYAQRIKDGAPSGEAVLVKRDVGSGQYSLYSVLNDGRLLYSTVEPALPKLYSVAINEQTGELLSKPVVVADRFAFDKYSDLVLSADGQWLAGRAQKEGTSDYELCVVRVDGTQPRHIATEMKSFRVSGWLDGKSFLVRGIREEMGEKAGHFRVDSTSGAIEMLLGPWGSDGFGRLSPDGRQLAMALQIDGAAALHTIGIAPGSQPKLLRKKAATPTWSPDGKSIAFHSTDSNGSRRLFVMSAEGGEARELALSAHNKPNNDFPAWSSNGKFIVYNHDRPDGNGAGIWLVSPDGGKPIYLDVGIKHVYSHVWSADGKSLLFTGTNEEDQQHLWSLENYLPAE